MKVTENKNVKLSDGRTCHNITELSKSGKNWNFLRYSAKTHTDINKQTECVIAYNVAVGDYFTTCATVKYHSLIPL